MERQIGMEPHVIDSAKEEAKQARIIRNSHVYCLFVCLFLSFLDRQIGMEPRVIDSAKEEAKQARIIHNSHVYCLFVCLFLSQYHNNFFS